MLGQMRDDGIGPKRGLRQELRGGMHLERRMDVPVEHLTKPWQLWRVDSRFPSAAAWLY